MNEKNLTIEEVQAKIAEYFDDERANFGVQSYGCEILVGIKYWDFHTEKQVRRDIEDMSDNIRIVDLQREISNEALSRMMMELFDREARIYAKDKSNALRETSLYDYIYSNISKFDLGKEKVA